MDKITEWYIKIALIVLGVFGGLLLVFGLAGKGHAHDTEILKCDKNLKVEQVKKLGENINPNGTISEAYDRNGDEFVDIEAISHVNITRQETGAIVIDHAEHPFLYVVDLDFDGNPDMVYVDKSGLGKCEDIVLYKDLTVPHNEDRNDGDMKQTRR